MYSAMAAGPTVPVTAYSQRRNRGQSSFHRSSGDGAGSGSTDVDAAVWGAAGTGSLALADRVASSMSIDKKTFAICAIGAIRNAREALGEASPPGLDGPPSWNRN